MTDPDTKPGTKAAIRTASGAAAAQSDHHLGHVRRPDRHPFRHQRPVSAAVAMILIAAVLDGLDGRIARLLKSESEIGAELDSLVDFVNFGVAPGLIMYMWGLHGAAKRWLGCHADLCGLLPAAPGPLQHRQPLGPGQARRQDRRCQLYRRALACRGHAGHAARLYRLLLDRAWPIAPRASGALHGSGRRADDQPHSHALVQIRHVQRRLCPLCDHRLCGADCGRDLLSLGDDGGDQRRLCASC